MTKLYFALLAALICINNTASACDLCSLYNASRLQGRNEGSLGLFISEQYTSYDRAQSLAENSIKDGELVRGYSTTQLGISYDVSTRLGLDLTLPFIARRFDNISNYRADTESDSGLGDMALTSTYSLVDYKDEKWAVIFEVTGGVKFPTGDTGVLETITEDEEADELFLRHHQIATTSGGQALTFGSGSYDYIFGANFLTRYKRILFITSSQYTIRTEGDFNYEYADDYLFYAAPGYYLILDHDFTLAGAISFTGEFKGKDTLDGEDVSGSAISNLYLGPSLLATFDDKIGAELSMDFRLSAEDANSTVVPETRIRASMSYNFN